MFDPEVERQKILNGFYSDKIIQGRQRKHIFGTKEFEQNRIKMKKNSPGSEPPRIVISGISVFLNA